MDEKDRCIKIDRCYVIVGFCCKVAKKVKYLIMSKLIV